VNDVPDELFSMLSGDLAPDSAEGQDALARAGLTRVEFDALASTSDRLEAVGAHERAAMAASDGVDDPGGEARVAALVDGGGWLKKARAPVGAPVPPPGRLWLRLAAAASVLALLVPLGLRLLRPAVDPLDGLPDATMGRGVELVGPVGPGPFEAFEWRVPLGGGGRYRLVVLEPSGDSEPLLLVEVEESRYEPSASERTRLGRSFQWHVEWTPAGSSEARVSPTQHVVDY
jgi:hypothetical protein